MLNFKSYINEAIELSIAREMTRRWKQKYDKIFGKKHRIYLKMDAKEVNIDSIQFNISNKMKYLNNVLLSQNYTVYDLRDYIKGLATHIRTGRKKRIGSLLKDRNHKKMYDNDPVRQMAKSLKEELMVVISRHPVDIAGASRGRGWDSCLNDLEMIYCEVAGGTLVAYLVKASDKNIQKPIGRLLIKPYYHETDRKKIRFYADESDLQGMGVTQFREVLKKWTSKVSSDKKGLYIIKKNIYQNDVSPIRDHSKSNAHISSGRFTNTMTYNWFNIGVYVHYDDLTKNEQENFPDIPLSAWERQAERELKIEMYRIVRMSIPTQFTINIVGHDFRDQRDRVIVQFHLYIPEEVGKILKKTFEVWK